jgi:transposase
VADTICRTAELGLSIDNAGDVTHLYCHPVSLSTGCPGCGQEGRVRDHVERRLTELPIAGHPSVLRVRVPRLVCGNDDCEVTICRAPFPPATGDRQSVTCRVTRWMLQRMVADGMSVKACARGLGIGWKKDARQVMDPFHVVHLAAGKLDLFRLRIQYEMLGHRGRGG